MTDRPTPAELDELLSHTRWVHALALRLLADEQLAEDVTQEALRVAVEKRPAGGPRLRAWFGRVVRHLAFNQRRGDARRLEREARAARAEASDERDLLAWAERMRAVVDAVRALEEPYRSAILRRYFDDWPVERIARQTGVDPATVRTRLKRGRDRLRLRLKNRWGEDFAACLVGLTPRLEAIPSAATPAAPAVLGPGSLLMVAPSKLLLPAAAVIGLMLLATLWPERDRALAPGEHRVEVVEAGASGLSERPGPLARERHESAPSGASRLSLAHDEDRLDVRCVDGFTGHAVPGAKVFVLDQSLMEGLAREFYSRALDHPDMFAEAHGRQAVADSKGLASVEFLGDRGWVFASHAGRWGRFELTRGELGELSAAQVEIPLFRDFRLNVEVVDARGAPVMGVPVRLLCGDPDRLVDAPTPVVHPTDEDGRICLRRLGAIARDSHGLSEQAGSAWGVRVEIPLDPIPFQRFDPVEQGDRPVRFVLAETAPVEVILAEADGERIAGPPQQVHLQRRMPDAWRKSRAPWAPDGVILPSERFGTQWVWAVDGVAHFDQVGIGFEIEIGTTYRDRQEPRFGYWIEKGPTAPGETLRLVLRRPEPSRGLQIRGRLSDETGGPWAKPVSVRVITWSAERGETQREETAQPDEQGRFHVRLDPIAAQAGLETACCVLANNQGSVRLWFAQVPEFTGVGELDLGELTLDARPMAEGQVLRWEGQPAAGAEVSFGRLMRNEEQPSRARLALARAISSALHVRTEEGGHFRAWFPDEVAAEGFRVTAEPGSADTEVYTAVSAECAPFTEGLELRLSKRAGLRGRLRVDPGLIDRVALSRFVPWYDEDGSQGGAHETVRSLTSTGEFRCDRACAEPTELLVQDETTRLVLHRVPIPPVPEGELVDLGAIDLRGQLAQRTVVATDRSGVRLNGLRLLAPGSVFLRGSQSPSSAVPLESGESFLASARPLEVLAVVPGYRPERLLLDRPEVQVTMTEGIQLEIEVIGLGALQEELALDYLLAQEVEVVEGIQVAKGAIGYVEFLDSPDDALVRARLPVAGGWGVSVIAKRRDAPNPARVFVGRANVTVQDSVGSQRARVVVAPEDLERIRTELGLD